MTNIVVLNTIKLLSQKGRKKIRNPYLGVKKKDVIHNCLTNVQIDMMSPNPKALCLF